MSVEVILIAGISALAGVISILWTAFFWPLVSKMMKLVERLEQEQPKQTTALKTLVVSNEAIRHATAQHLKLQDDHTKTLTGLLEAVRDGACRQPR